MIRTMSGSFGTVSLTVTGDGAPARSAISTRVTSRRAHPGSPRPLRCIDHFPIRPADGLDDMMN